MKITACERVLMYEPKIAKKRMIHLSQQHGDFDSENTTLPRGKKNENMNSSQLYIRPLPRKLRVSFSKGDKECVKSA
jgi:hypothetical protein